MNRQVKSLKDWTIVLLTFIVLFNCTVLAKYSGGTGEPNDPYQIADVNDLITLANDANDYNKFFIMIADINLDPNLPGGQVFSTAVISRDTIDDRSNYYDGNAFTGVFDGAGHKIINLTINAESVPYEDGNDYLGLFGFIDNGKVKNLGIENVSIIGGGGSVCIGGMSGILDGNNGSISNCYSTGVFNGAINVGGLVGYNRGHIIDSFSQCNIIAGQYCSSLGGLAGVNASLNHPRKPIIIGDINNCYSTGIVTGGDWASRIGGFVGSNSGKINNCYSTGAVNSGFFSEYIGGFTGENVPSSLHNIVADIENCYSTGPVTGGDLSSYVGGFVGSNSHHISSCYSTGSVTGGDSDFIGGFSGANNNFGDINGCFSTGNITGTYNIGGLVGHNGYDSNIRNSYSLSDVTGIGGSNRVGGLVGLNNMVSSINNCYSAGTVSGSSGVGGLVGVNTSSINSSYFLDAAGPNNGNGTPLTDEEMKQQASFIDWDFNDIWSICETTNYPKLLWQISAGDFVCPDGVNIFDLNEMCEQWLVEEIPADLAPPPSGDGIVDFADFSIFANQWGITNDMDELLDFTGQWLKMGLPICSADISPTPDGDGQVDAEDFALMAENWLQGTY